MTARVLAVAVVALAAVAFSEVACTDGDGGSSQGDSEVQTAGAELALEEYYAQIDAVFDDVERLGASFQSGSSLLEPGLSIEEQRQIARDYFDGALPIVQQLVAGMEAIEPPAEVAAQHEAFVSVYRDALQGAQGAAASIDAAPVEDLVAMLSDFVSALLEGSPACTELKQVADENRITTRLNC